MEILKYGNFEIVPDFQMTKDYYSNLKPAETQVARNFAEYCKNMPEEEKSFFENFGKYVYKSELVFLGAKTAYVTYC